VNHECSIDVQSGLLSGELFAPFTPSVQGRGVGIEWKLKQSTVDEYRQIQQGFNHSIILVSSLWAHAWRKRERERFAYSAHSAKPNPGVFPLKAPTSFNQIFGLPFYHRHLSIAEESAQTSDASSFRITIACDYTRSKCQAPAVGCRTCQKLSNVEGTTKHMHADTRRTVSAKDVGLVRSSDDKQK